jgi:signal peptidase II
MWPLFLALVPAVVIPDQLTKAWIVARLQPREGIEVLGDYVRLVHSQNTGGLFGFFRDQAPIFAVMSIVVVGLIAWYHARGGRSPYLSLTLGLLTGGAIGNLLDRLRLGHVVDFVDVGIGDLRWYTFNVADMAISASLILLLLLALRPSLANPTGADGQDGDG